MRFPIALTATILTLGLARADSPKMFIYDALNRPDYRKAYDHMISNERGMPQWMASAQAAMRSTAVPGTTRNVDGEEREIFAFCQPHDCGGHHFMVMFGSINSAPAKGLLLSDANVRFFGNPTLAERRALMSVGREQ